MRFISIFIYILIMSLSIKSFSEEKFNFHQINDARVLFLIDDHETQLPDNIMELLKTVPTNELSNALLYDLMQTQKYEGVIVNEYKDNQLNTKVYVVHASYIKKIQDIIFNGIISSEQINYQKNLSLQTGKVFKKYLVNDDIQKIRSNLEDKGYPKGIVLGYKVVSSPSNFVNLIYSINKKSPCRIDQIEVKNSNQNILNFINLPIQTGSVCDISSINEKLFQIKNDYMKQGYLNAKAYIDKLIYSQNKESAKLILYIDKGSKIILQIKDKNGLFLFDDFLNSKQTVITSSDLYLTSTSDLKSMILIYFREQGYLSATVTEPKIIIDSDSNKYIQFFVDKKNFVNIGHIYFVGNLPESKEEILKKLGLYNSFFNNIPFVQKDLLIYRDKLKNILLTDGYADAQVSVPDYTLINNEQTANLIFNINMGDKYLLTDIQFKNKPANFEFNMKKLKQILSVGMVVNFDNKQNYLMELKSQLLDFGFLYSQIKIEQSVEQNDQGIKFVTLIVSLDSGPIVTIGKVFLQGDTFNKTNSIISVSGLEYGQKFTQALLENARNQILRHDLFSSVVVEPIDVSAIDRKETILDLIIRLRGRMGYSMTLSPGWGNAKGYRFEADYSLNNITNDGLRMISSAGVSQEKQQLNFASTETRQILGQEFTLGLIEPLLKLGPLYTPLDTSLIGSYQIVAETLTNREYQTLNLLSDWKPSFFDINFKLTSDLIHEKSTSTSSESAVVQTIDSPSIVIREFLNTISLDTRNNFAWPTKGAFASFGFGMARFGFGSGVQYNRYLPKLDVYFPIFQKLSGAILFGGNFVTETSNGNGETVTPPASRRSTLTDDALIRGFPETYGAAAPGPLLWIHYNPNTSAPNCNTQLASVGGTNLIYIKSEARLRFNDVFGMVGFLDTGESYFTPKEAYNVNNQINKQISPLASSTGQCVVDRASLITPDSPRFEGANFFEEYWRQAYVSTGIGLRVILGNIASISLDYGYPLKAPSQNQDGCVTPAQAVSSGTAPVCITRIQDSTYDLQFMQITFKGAFHLGVGAQF